MLRPRHARYALAVLSVLLAAAPCPSAPAQGGGQQAAGSGRQLVFFGTYTRRSTSKGIYAAELELATGKLAPARLAAESDDPSFLAIHPNGKLLYAVNETGDFGGEKSGSGAVSAFAIDLPSGQLTLLNQQPSKGAAPCHLVVDATGKYVLTANYTGGSICVHPIGSDGKLGTATSFVQHEGKGAKPGRQDAPHAHSINLDPANRYAFVADLGLDKVLSYRFDAGAGTLTPNPAGNATLKPGAGPRHFAFRRDARFAFVNNEMQSTVTALAYNAERGALTEIHTLSTLPADFDPQSGNSTAECQVHPSGKFVYVSNRGHNSIAIYAIDPSSGRLTHVGNESTQGRTPRNFGIDPTGTYLLAENQASNSVVVFRIDAGTGKLSATGHTLEVPSPVCAKFLAL